MSDSNLKNDQFFHNLIKQSPDRMISLNYLDKCSKIKEMNVNWIDIVNAIK